MKFKLKGVGMKAITLWQPWASLMAHGLKKNDTRHWRTSYRGPLLIHAAKKVIGWPSIDIQCAFDDEVAFNPCDLPLGKILCQVDLIECEKIRWNTKIGYPESEFGDYTIGRYVWRTENLLTFDEPILFKGSQGFFNVPDDLLFLTLKGGKK